MYILLDPKYFLFGYCLCLWAVFLYQYYKRRQYLAIRDALYEKVYEKV